MKCHVRRSRQFSLGLALALAVPLAPFPQLIAPALAQDANAKIESVNNLIRNGDLAGIKAAVEADPKLPENPRAQVWLYYAVTSGKVDIVKYLLEKKLDPKTQTFGNDPLSSAINYWGPEWQAMAETLIAAGAEINGTDQEGQTPLQRVLSYGGNLQKEKVNWLLGKGADIYSRNRYGRSAIDIVISSSSPELGALILDKADVKKTDENGNTPLFAAVSRIKPQFVTLLLGKGADVNARNNAGETVLDSAARFPGPLLKILLDAGARTDIRNNRGDLPLHIGLRRNDGDIRKGGITMVDNEFVQVGTGAIDDSARAALLAPLINKSDINAKDQFGISPLLLAILSRDQESRDLIVSRSPKMDATTQLFDAVSQGNLAVVKTLLAQKPFLVFFRLPDGTTPLHISALWGTLGVAQNLVQKGADVNARDAEGVTPLMNTLWRPTGLFSRRAKNMMAFLIGKGADAGALDANDSTALHRAVKSGDPELVDPLIAKNVDVNARDKSGETPIFGLMDADSNLKILRILLDRGASVNLKVRNANGGPLLSRAASTGRADLVSMLLDKGADVNLKDSDGRTALASMIYSGLQSEKGAAVAELLLAKGADPNEKIWDESLISRVISYDSKPMLRVLLASKKVNLKVGANRESPLRQAVNYGRTEMVPMLLEAGADPNETDEQGRTIAQMAATRSKEMADFFKPKAPAAG